jgi:hypothetical protein
MRKGEMAGEICENVHLNTPYASNPDPSTASADGVIQIGDVTTFPSTDIGQEGETPVLAFLQVRR